MNIHNVHLLLIGGLLFLLTGCMDLEREDFTEIYPDNFFKTETDLKLAVDGLYYDFGTGDWGGNGKAPSVFISDYNGYQTFSDMTTDVMWCNWGWQSDEYYFHQWTVTAGSVQSQFWNMFSHYNYLSKARNTIRRIEESPVKEDIKKKYLGEAHALRGWMGLYLYDLFGPVPVASDDILDNPETFVYLPRLTDEEYDAMMEEDLLNAIAMLPEMPEARGRIAKGAARMILLKYYMIRGHFEKAEVLARDLYAMEGNYTLQSDYSSIFSLAGAGNSEVILQRPCNATLYGSENYLTASFLPTDMPWTDKSTGWGGYVMAWDFYDTYEPGDKRLENMVFTSYVNTSGKTVTRTDMKYGAVTLKYGKDPGMTDAKSNVDIVVYRYSDVLLSLAELIVRNGGPISGEATRLVNRVRNRAGLGNLSAAQTADTDAFLEAILLERGHEFYCEGLRRQDLIRFGKYVEYANNRIDKINAEERRGYYNVNDSHNRLPIPASFIDESKSAIKQNPLY